ncbi:hypothetical protein G6F68_010311 [Rhizopus microsporus]|nr:hypothetical protein G6F68_010311 [Rhizopus microsporus]
MPNEAISTVTKIMITPASITQRVANCSRSWKSEMSSASATRPIEPVSRTITAVCRPLIGTPSCSPGCSVRTLSGMLPSSKRNRLSVSESCQR